MVTKDSAATGWHDKRFLKMAEGLCLDSAYLGFSLFTWCKISYANVGDFVVGHSLLGWARARR